MLELTVKTLDSQNHSFTLSDEASVLNLKESILEKMEVPIANQRLIFHGKVLQDFKKLTDYGDVNGKVIHLVQRAPPSSSRASDSSTSRRTEGHMGGGGRRFLRPNAISMTIPALGGFGDDFGEGLELPTRPCQAMARNRLDCAKRMMNYARQSIRQMEDPTIPTAVPILPTSSRQSRRQREAANSSGENPEDAPSNEQRGTSNATGNDQLPESMMEAAIALVNTISRVESNLGEASSRNDASAPSSEDNINFDHQDVAVEVEVESSDAGGDNRNEPEANVRDNSAESRPNARHEEGARVDAMVPLLSDLQSLNSDLEPFLLRCREVLSADTSFDDSSSPAYLEAVRMFNGVSETLHSLAHAYHALSDLMVDFDEDAPRSLRCRPVVLQHSTILEAGIPLPLASPPLRGFNREDGPPVHIHAEVSTGGSLRTPATEATPRDTSANANPAPPTSAGPAPVPSAPNQPRPNAPSARVQLSRYHLNASDGIPHDLEIFMDFGLSPMDASTPEATPPPTSAEAESATTNAANTTDPQPPAAPTVPEREPGQHTLVNIAIPNNGVPFLPFHVNNWQQLAGEIRQFAMRQAPSSIRTARGPAASRASRDTPNNTTETETQTAGAAFSSSTPTNTTSTGTNAAPQQAAAGSQTTPQRIGNWYPPMTDVISSLFQGTFDHALPCSSHHIRRTRQRVSQAQRLRVDVVPTTAQIRRGPMVGMPFGDLQSFVSELLPGFPVGSLPAEPYDGQTFAELFSSIVGGQPPEGSSVVRDLLYTMVSNLSWFDLIDLVNSRYSAVLNRLRPLILEFANRRLLQGESPSQESISRACVRLNNELRPYLDAIQLTRQRESIDFAATIDRYNRATLPALLGSIVTPGSPHTFGSNLITLVKGYIRNLIALVQHCCVDGQGFDSAVRSCVRLLTQGVPNELQEWTEVQSLDNIREYTSNLNVPLEEISSFIVPINSNVIPADVESSASAPPEPMETDYVWSSSATLNITKEAEDKATSGANAGTNAETLIAMDTGNLPEVLIGSEPWHATLPSEWVPVIARDSQRQRRQNAQKPFSDAYLTGIPPKRRKIISAAKPPDTLQQTISEGMRHAIQAAGVSSPLAERAIAEAGRDPTLQQAHREHEKAAVAPIIKNDPDFSPSRYPNAHNYFNQ